MTLQQLRSDPTQTAKRATFVVGRSDYYDAKGVGGRCRVACEDLGKGVYKLALSGGAGHDFYCPYVTPGSNPGYGHGIGLCSVPLDAPQGTIVLTAGMNGCALEVRRGSDFLCFIHDANSKCIQNLDAGQPAERACRIDADQYWDGEMAGILGDIYKRKYKETATTSHYLITVKTESGWVVLHSPAFMTADLSLKEGTLGQNAPTTYRRFYGGEKGPFTF